MVVQKDSVAEDWLFGGNVLDFLDFFTAGSFTMLSPSAQILDGSEGVRGQWLVNLTKKEGRDFWNEGAKAMSS